MTAGILGLGLLAGAWAGWSWLSPPDPVDPTEGVVVASTATPSGLRPTSAASHPPEPTPSVAPGTSSSVPEAAARVTPTPNPQQGTRVLRFELPSAGYASDVGTMEVADKGAISPPDFRRTWWIRDRGVLPSAAATDTTYLACHTDAKKAVTAVPCNKVNLGNVPVGADVRVTTDTEQLTYRITDARKIPRDDFASDAAVWGVNPGRLVWVSCYLSEGRRSDFNIVVIAELVRS